MISKQFRNQVTEDTSPWSGVIPFQQLRESSGGTVELCRFPLRSDELSPPGYTGVSVQGVPIPQHGPLRLLHMERAPALQPCLWTSRKIQTCFNFPWKHKLLLSVCTAQELLLLWLLVVIYQLHPGSAADFNNYSGFTTWFHPHFISRLLQHALYMLYIPPAHSVLYEEMMYPRSPRVCLKKLYNQVSS